MPKTFYTCNTLASLRLFNKILVDAPSPVSLPSLTQLELRYVVYKDEDSHVRLLSGCPALKHLVVARHPYWDGDVDVDVNVDDNVRKFSVKVPTLKKLEYSLYHNNEDITDMSLVIDTPALTHLSIISVGLEGSCSIEYMPHLARASFDSVVNPVDNLLSSLSSIKYLELYPLDTMVPWCNAIHYSRLIKCRLGDFHPELCESLVVLLSNCPQLKVLTVDSFYEIDRSENHVPAVLWDQPSSVPKCLSSYLEFFKYAGYAGREDEKELVWYIVENSKCLKRAEVWLNLTCNLEEKQKMTEELKSLPKVVTSALKPDRPVGLVNSRQGL